MSTTKFSIVSLIIAVLLTCSAYAEDKSKVTEAVVLEVGDEAPAFSGQDDQGKAWESKKLAGKKILIVYFYPADMTGGCTKQACSYRDAVAELKRDDVEVIGVSGDSVENHKHFKNEYNLNFTLLADPQGKIAKAFGVSTSDGGSIDRVIGGKDVTLTRGVTAKRWTFVIDKDGRIAHKDMAVNAERDSDVTLAVVEKLN